MKDRFIVSTTGNIEGGTIKQYIDVVCSNVVVGTNIFSDFAASFTDFFGGKSESYRNKLEYIYNEALKDLKRKAAEMGANSIIGFKVDFDEISGKDKSMFMVSLSGTACKVIYSEEDETTKNSGIVSQQDLDREIKRRLIIRRLNEGANMKDDWALFLIENPQPEILEELIGLYVKYSTNSLAGDSGVIENILRSYPKKSVQPVVYKLYAEGSNEDIILSLIENCNLFSATHVQETCKKDIHKGIKLLSAKTDYYTSNDLEEMNRILNVFENLPDTGRIEKVKSGIFSKKEEDTFICENNHKNPVSYEFCESCWINIKGLRQDEVKKIKSFTERVSVLNEILGTSKN